MAKLKIKKHRHLYDIGVDVKIPFIPRRGRTTA